MVAVVPGTQDVLKLISGMFTSFLETFFSNFRILVRNAHERDDPDAGYR